MGHDDRGVGYLTGSGSWGACHKNRGVSILPTLNEADSVADHHELFGL
jgi:hypothetical protein